MKFLEETWKTSQQQTKFGHEKFYLNHPKSFKKCSIVYKILQKFTVFQPGIIFSRELHLVDRDIKQQRISAVMIRVFYICTVPRLCPFRIWKNVLPTENLARAKLPSNAGNFTCSSQVKNPTRSLPALHCSPLKTSKFTCVDVASTSRRKHAICLPAHVNLPEYHGYFTGDFTCKTHATLPATSMRNCLLLQAQTLESQVKIPAQSQAIIPAILQKNTCNCRQSTITPRLKSPSNCKKVSLHPAGEVTCNFSALISAIACIRREVIAP